jgi:outer membrane protein assembly factor BamB
VEKMTKIIVGILLCLLFLQISISVKGNIHNDDSVFSRPVSQIDWWPMYHHDLQNTGYSTSKAPGTNRTLWVSSMNDRILSSPALLNGRVYVGSDDCGVYCLNAENGHQVWNVTAGTTVFFSAVVDKKVFFGNGDGGIYCIDALQGTFLWRYETAGHSILSSPAIANGKLYIGSTDGNLYCFGEDE